MERVEVSNGGVFSDLGDIVRLVSYCVLASKKCLVKIASYANANLTTTITGKKVKHLSLVTCLVGS